MLRNFRHHCFLVRQCLSWVFLNVRKHDFMYRPRFNVVWRTALFPKPAVFGTAIESLVYYTIRLPFLFHFGKHCTPTIGTFDNPSENVVISAWTFPDNRRSALQNLLNIVPAVLFNDWLMCAIDNFTLRIWDILSFLGMQGGHSSYHCNRHLCKCCLWYNSILPLTFWFWHTFWFCPQGGGFKLKNYCKIV